MLNVYETQYLAAQHRDELLRQAEQDRLAQAVTASDTAGGAAEAPVAVHVSLFARLRRTLHVRSTSPVAGASM